MKKQSSSTINNMNRIVEEEDRISCLPDALIHHVFSFMETRDAVQTCVLSKRWINVWKSLPYLNFYIYGFRKQSGTLNDFFDRVLKYRDYCSIQTLRVIWSSYCVSISSVNRWIDVAVMHNVQEVTIELSQYSEGFGYDISPRLLNCKSLKKLKLRVSCGDGFHHTGVILPKSKISLPQLKFMCLDGFVVYDVDLSKRLFSSCPALETLSIHNCDIQTDNKRNFTIESLSLKQFAYTYTRSSGFDHIKTETMKLVAPNLNSFTCKCYWRHDINVQNFSDQLSDVNLNIEYHFEYEHLRLEEKQVYARRMVKLLAAVDKVKRLKLSPGFLEVLSSATDLVNCKLPCLSNLQSLNLETWFTRGSLRSIAYLLAISPNVKTLILTANPKRVELRNRHQWCQPYTCRLLESNFATIPDDWDVGFSLPDMLSHLSVVQIKNAEGSDDELKILNFLLKNAKGLEEIALYASSTVECRYRLRKKYRDELRADGKSLFTHENEVESNRKYPFLHIVN